LLKERCEQDGLGTTDEVLARQFRLPLHRGIAYLATPHAIRSLANLVRLAVESPAPATGQQAR
jgi:DNA sulfur modification protein DndE